MTIDRRRRLYHWLENRDGVRPRQRLLQLAKRCNAECKQAISQDQPTFPILTQYAQQANNIGASQARLVYQLAILNGVIKPK